MARFGRAAERVPGQAAQDRERVRLGETVERGERRRIEVDRRSGGGEALAVCRTPASASAGLESVTACLRRVDGEPRPSLCEVGGDRQGEPVGSARQLRPQQRVDHVDVVVLVAVLGVQEARHVEDPRMEGHRLADQRTEARLSCGAHQLEVMVPGDDVDAIAGGGEASERREEGRVPPPDPVERGVHGRFGRVDPLVRTGGARAGLEEVERVAEQEEVGVRAVQVVDEAGERFVVERVVVRPQMQVADDDDVAH